METLPQRMSGALLDLWAVVATWPFYALGLVLLGSWLQDHVDALLRSHEGKPSWLGYRLLRTRIGFTRRVIQRPFWYRNDDKISREVARANTALERGGFAPLTRLVGTAKEPSDRVVEHLRAVEALIGGVGYDRAAILSHRILDAPGPSEVILPNAAGISALEDPDRGAVDHGRTDMSHDAPSRRRRWLPSITITVGRN